MSIKNLVFDIGNVLIGFRWMDMLMEYGMEKTQARRFGRSVFDHPLWKEFDLENIPFGEVVERYVQAFPEQEKDIRFLLGHLELMPVGRPAVWQKIHELKAEGYRIYLLSNYSSVMLRAHTKDAAFWDEIDGGVISYQIHDIKPCPGIYQALLKKYQLLPGETVFFDDREENIKGAEREGIAGVQVFSEEQLLEELDRFYRLRGENIGDEQNMQ